MNKYKHTCSKCPIDYDHTLDKDGFSTSIRDNGRSYAKHVLDSHLECTMATAHNLNNYWLDKEGRAIWTSEEDMVEAKSSGTRKKVLENYDIATNITKTGIQHVSLIFDTSKTEYRCSCYKVMKNTRKQEIIKEMKHHVLKNHYQDGIITYLLSCVRSKQPISENNNDESGAILVCTGEKKWHIHPANEPLPNERAGSMVRAKGQAWIAK